MAAARPSCGSISCGAANACTGTCSSDGTSYTCYQTGVSSYAWRTTPAAENCADGVDNDCDGLVDCKDPSCDSNSLCCRDGTCAAGYTCMPESDRCLDTAGGGSVLAACFLTWNAPTNASSARVRNITSRPNDRSNVVMDIALPTPGNTYIMRNHNIDDASANDIDATFTVNSAGVWRNPGYPGADMCPSW